MRSSQGRGVTVCCTVFQVVRLMAVAAVVPVAASPLSSAAPPTMLPSPAARSHRFSFAFNDDRFSDRILCIAQVTGGEHKSHIASLDEAEGDDSKRSNKPASAVLRRLHVSSILLASDSRFFKAMLTNGFEETQSKEIQVKVFLFLSLFFCGDVISVLGLGARRGRGGARGDASAVLVHGRVYEYHHWHDMCNFRRSATVATR